MRANSPNLIRHADDGTTVREQRRVYGDHYHWTLLETHDDDAQEPTIYLGSGWLDDFIAIVSEGEFSDATPRTLLSDEMGTVQALVSPSGAVLERYEYGPYGERVVIDAPTGDVLPASAFGVLIGFQGHPSLGLGAGAGASVQGLVEMRYRTYSPGMGRFLTRDPLGYIDGMNIYRFGMSNPISANDPLGLSSKKTTVIQGGAGAAKIVGFDVSFSFNKESEPCPLGCGSGGGEQERVCVQVEAWVGMGIGGRVRFGNFNIDLLYKAFGVDGTGFGCSSWQGCGQAGSCKFTVGVTGNGGIQNSFQVGAVGFSISVQTRATLGFRCELTFDACKVRFDGGWCNANGTVDISATGCVPTGIFGTVCRRLGGVRHERVTENWNF